MSFATRLVTGTLLVLVLAVAVLLFVAERSLRRDLVGDIECTLESEAGLIREALPPDSLAWGESVRRLAANQGNRRITLVDSSGRVRADSDFPPGPLPAIENHLDRPEIRAAIEFRRHNLMDQPPPGFRFDVIFCRNVMIYMDSATQQRVVKSVSACLEPGGYLLIGHAESLSAISHDLAYVQPSIYHKPALPPRYETRRYERAPDSRTDR